MNQLFTTEIKQIDNDRISILGQEYYTKDYLKSMMERAYADGFDNGIRIGVKTYNVKIEESYTKKEILNLINNDKRK
jgi:hypothetical protein